MNGIGADSESQIHDLSPIEESLHRTRSDEVGFIGFFDVNAGRIGFGINSGGCDIQLAAGADDSHGDLTAIGHQDFLKHLPLLLQSSHARLRTNRRKGARKLA
jgi:hypothetical protein